jgi:hypothetical protein
MRARLDQIAAAVAETRAAVNAVFGLPADQKPEHGTSPFVEQLLDILCVPEVPRCPHLAARPVQPAVMSLPWLEWRCRPCCKTFSESMNGRSLGVVEEFTCDRCRRYVPSGPLTPAVLRQDMWVIIASLCKRCTALAEQHGGQHVGGAP